MNISGDNVPPQAARLLDGRAKVTTYETTGGGVTSAFASYALSLLPPIPAGSVIHDNACGSGTVSRLIVSVPTTSGPSSSIRTPQDIRIHATDIDQPFLDVLSEDAAAHNWPITVAHMDSNALSFPDNTFTHSLTNIAIFFTADAGLRGAKEVHRTLRPGGTAVINCWASIAWSRPIFATHKKFRSQHPFPAPTTNWADGQQLRSVLKEAGFAEDKTRVEKHEAWARTTEGELRGWVEMAWAYLAGVAGWYEGDGDTWEEQVDLCLEQLMASEDTKRDAETGDIMFRASQWLAIVEK